MIGIPNPFEATAQMTERPNPAEGRDASPTVARVGEAWLQYAYDLLPHGWIVSGPEETEGGWGVGVHPINNPVLGTDVWREDRASAIAAILDIAREISVSGLNQSPATLDPTVRRSAAASTIYFPVRSNAHSLIAGAPAKGVEARVKVAALLYEQVLVGDGMWTGVASEAGTVEQKHRRRQQDPPRFYQRSVERATLQASPFELSLWPQGAPEPLEVVADHTGIAWSATFDPLRRALPHAFDWIEFHQGDLSPEDKGLVSNLSERDLTDGRLASRFDNAYERRLVIGSANYDLVSSARLGAVLCPDPLHYEVVKARVDRGEADSVQGVDALSVLVPDIGKLSWDDVNALRARPGFRRLRPALAELEIAAIEAGGRYDVAIRRLHGEALEAALAATVPDVRSTIRRVTIGAAIGSIPGVGGALAAAADSYRDHRQASGFEASWLAAIMRLRRAVRA